MSVLNIIRLSEKDRKSDTLLKTDPYCGILALLIALTYGYFCRSKVKETAKT